MAAVSDIFITGYGLISALGCGADAHIDALMAGRQAIAPPRFLETRHSGIPVGEVLVSDDELAARLSLGEPYRRLRSVLLGVYAVREALDMAGIDRSSRSTLPFVNGTTVGGMDNTERRFADMTGGDEAAMREFALNSCGACTSLIAKATGLGGITATSSTACSSGANAIILGARLIEAGLADTVVAGGTEALTRFHLNGFKSLMILDSERCRPFDAARRGINLGEGAGYLVLESGAAVRRRGITPIARLAGWANTCDAFHQTATSDNGDGPYLAMSEAITKAGLSPADIDYINTHGTGTPNNDASELAAMRRLFGDSLPCYTSTKSLTGHTTSASGGLEAAICALGLHRGFMPAAPVTSMPSDEANPPMSHSLSARYNTALCNAFGFGGNCSALILTSR